MNKSTPFTLLFLGIGVACAALLIWLWREGTSPSELAGNPPQPAIQSAEIPSAAKASGPNDASAVNDEIRSIVAALARAMASGNAREREVVLTFKDDAAMRRFIERAGRSGLQVLGQLGALRSARFRYDSSSALQRALAEGQGDYADASANGLIGVPRPPPQEARADVDQVPFGNEMLAFVGAIGDRSSWGRGTTIAVLDTGIASDATFGNGRMRTLDIGFGIAPATGDEGGHGTAVAALAAGMSTDAAGVAPAASVLSIRVTDENGTSDLFTVAHAIVTAADAGAKIINVSLGGYSTGTVLDAAIAYARERSAVIVAAAGNDQAAQLAWPAADARVISVGAVDRAEQQVSFSNSGPQLQLSAPGYGVQTAWLNGQRVYVDGTSASAPIVAGAIAAIMSQNSGLSAQQAADLLIRTANDAGSPGADTAFGRGILNLATAMNSGNAAYVDTAVSSHSFNSETGQMQFVVQNRSGRTISGMSLEVSNGTATTRQTVPSLVAGETYVAKIPVSDVTLQSAGNITFSTQLVNPPGTADQVPANNRRSSVLTVQKKK